MEESRCEWVDWPSSRPDTFHGALLPVILGAGAQGNPPLGCSGSPRSKGSRGRGLNSRLGREEASRTLQEWKGQSSHISLLPPCCFCCCPRARAIPNLSPSISSIHRGCPWTPRGLPPDLSRQRMWTRAAGPANSLCSHLLAQATAAISHRALLLPGTSLLSTNTPSSKDPSLTQPGIRALREPVLGLAGRVCTVHACQQRAHSSHRNCGRWEGAALTSASACLPAPPGSVLPAGGSPAGHPPGPKAGSPAQSADRKRAK